MLYTFLKWLARFIFWILGVKAEGVDNLPLEGPVIVAGNHVSIWDPVLIAAYLPRKVSFMAKEELFEHNLLAAFFSKLNAFPVKRGIPDRKAIKNAMDILEHNGVLGIFPEGTRSKTGELSKPQNGIAMLALKAQALVVPVACIGTNKGFPWGRKTKVMVRYGEPVHYDKYFDTKINITLLEEVSKDIMDRISNLLQ